MALVTPAHIGRQSQSQQYAQQLRQHIRKLHARQQVQQRHDPARTNKRTRVAISRLQRAMPEHEDTVLLMLFGSRARGDYRRGSDIDLLHIVKGNCNRWDQKHFDIVRRSIGNAWTTAAATNTIAAIKQINVMVETTRSVKKRWNLYGMMEYWAMAEGVMIYGRQPHAGRLLDQYHAITDKEASKRWLAVAEKIMREGAVHRNHTTKQRDTNFSCFMMHRAIEGALRALLLHHGTRFPFARDCRPLYEMLPDRSVTRPYDIDRIAQWRGLALAGSERGPDTPTATPEEYAYAESAARDILNGARDIIHG